MKTYFKWLLAVVLLAFPVGLYADNYSPGGTPTPKTFATDTIGGMVVTGQISSGADLPVDVSFTWVERV